MAIVVSASSTTGALADVRSCIQFKGYGSDTAPGIQNSMINSVYRRIIGMYRWPFLELADNSTIICNVGQMKYNIGVIEDLLHIDAVRIEFGTDYYDLEYAPFQTFRNLEHTERSQAVPRYWTAGDQELRLWPAPDREYIVKIDYIIDPPDLVGDTDVPIIPPAYRDVLCWGAIAELTFRERDVEGYNIAKQEYLSIIDNMKAEYGVKQRQTSEQVGRSGTYDILVQ
jgi:hypothetical protein